ncbi:MAG: ABC transporter permease subunit [Gammaproteobacteria bacterium]|jgi:microcin C transport system permease protein
MRLNPLTARKLRRFREIKRGYYSFVILVVLTVLSLFAELLINDKPLLIKYEGQLMFPTYGSVKLGSAFGLEGQAANTPVNYRELARTFQAEDDGNFVILPPVPYNPYENTEVGGLFRAAPPDFASKHFLGTDTTGRDILARLFYGFRTAILFAIAFTVLTYLIGIALGCMMGYFGGLFDLLFQRIIEIWSNIPFLYMVIIVFSVIPATFSIPTRISILLLIMVLFSWTFMTYYMRTETYREKARDYALAARVLGASTSRIIFRHILPNTISTIVTFIPFTVVAAITAITALDFLGWGLPPPTPSIGELLKQGTANLTTAPWIVTSAFVALVVILTLVTFIGEAIREAFDPKKFTIYR